MNARNFAFIVLSTLVLSASSTTDVRAMSPSDLAHLSDKLTDIDGTLWLRQSASKTEIALWAVPGLILVGIAAYRAYKQELRINGRNLLNSTGKTLS